MPAEVILGRRFTSLLDRFDNDHLYRERCLTHNLWTRDDMEAVEELGRSEPQQGYDLPWWKRQEYWGDKTEVVSSQRGGRNTQRPTASSEIRDPENLLTSTAREDETCWEGHYIRIDIKRDRKRKPCSWCSHEMKADEDVAYCRQCQKWYCKHCLDRPKPREEPSQSSTGPRERRQQRHEDRMHVPAIDALYGLRR